MSTLLETFSSPTWSNLVVALLHSLWLGVLAVALLTALLRQCGNDPERRYRRAVATLSGLVVSVFIAWACQDVTWTRVEPRTIRTVSEKVSESTALASTTRNARPAGVSLPQPSRSWMGALALVWSIGALGMTTRLLSHLVATDGVRRASVMVREGPFVELLSEVQRTIGFHRLVRLAANSAIAVPSVVGIISPVILLPAQFVTGVPSEHIRAILLHELAHIRRHDYLVNLVQHVLEAVLFFNPAVWWINRQIRLEREACCDQLAVGATSEGAYATALASFAEAAHTSFAPAFPGDRPRSTLVERVRRILISGYEPVVRLPWTSSLAVLFCAGVLLFSAWRGTRLAVTLAAEFLTAQKRIEKIATLRSELGAEERTYTDADNILVEGQVRTADGEPLPKPLLLSYSVSNPQASISLSGAPMTNGHFRLRIKYGEVHLSVWPYTNYAPVFSGPLRTTPGGTITNVNLVLQRGHSATIQVVKANGEPLPNAELEGLYQVGIGSVPIKLTSDRNGMVTVAHCAEVPMRWTAAAHGFQSAVFENIRLSDGQPTRFALKPARPTTGLVATRDGQKPIPNARLRLLYRSGGSVMADVSQAAILATTDAAGRFHLDSLPDGFTHILAVEAEGYGTKIVHGVEAGQSAVRVELGPEITLAGEIRGDLSRLVHIPDPVISAAQPLQLTANDTHSFSHNIPVFITDDKATFALSNLWDGEVTLNVGPQAFSYVLHDSKTNLVIHLPSVAENAPARRAIQVRFVRPQNAPPVIGQLEVTRASEEESVYQRGFIPITNSEARFEAQVGTWFSWTPRAIVGYWTPENMNTKVEAGEGPQIIELPVLPAGAIHGVVRDENGADVGGVMISVVEVRAAPGKQPGSLGEVGKNKGSAQETATRFVAQPLPLGGEYMLVAHRGNQYVASEVVALTEKQPIREIDLRLVAGEALRGIVRDYSGKPLPNVPLALNYETPFGSAFGIAGFGSVNSPATDAKGSFSIPGLNPALPGKYTIIVDHAFGFQPISKRIRFGEPLELRLNRGLKLAVTVLNELSKKPLAGANFYVTASQFRPGDLTNFIEADAASDPAGQVQFTRLAEREYDLHCRDGDIVSGTTKLRLPIASQERLVIRLKPIPGARLWEDGERIAN